MDLKSIYSYDEEKKKYGIDVQLEDYRDAYSEWDFSPFHNRDLDDDLIEFLLESSYEIPLKFAIMINFHILNQDKSERREERTLKGIHNFFTYQLRKLRNYRMRVIRDLVSFLIIGCVLLLVGFYLKQLTHETLFTSVLSEGIFVGGWVMLWEMFTVWFFDLNKVSNKIKHYNRLLGTEIIFTYKEKDA